MSQASTPLPKQNGNALNQPSSISHSTASNGRVLTLQTTSANHNGQLGANAMINLAKMASQPQPKHTIQTNVAFNAQQPQIINTSGVNLAQHTVVCQGSPMSKPSTTQVVMSPAPPTVVQQRPQFSHQNVVRVSQPGQNPVNISQPIIIPRGASTISLPPGVSLPPGTILMQNEKGQIVFMSRAPAPQNFEQQPMVRHRAAVGGVPGRLQATQPQLTPRTQTNPAAQTMATGSPGHMLSSRNVTSYPHMQQPGGQAGGVPIQPNPGAVIMRPGTMPIRPNQPIVQNIRPAIPQSMADRTKEEIKKCKNFLETLIRLSSQQPQQTLDNVKRLIQGLLDGSVLPDAFTTRLQKELNSSKQPGLAAFLKKSLPELRLAIRRNELTIDGLDRQPVIAISPVRSNSATTTASSMQHTFIRPPSSNIKPSIKPGVVIPAGPLNSKPMSTPTRPIINSSPVRHHKSPHAASRFPAAGSTGLNTSGPAPKGRQRLDLKDNDDDDIIDVAAMGGVNLSEESKNILAAVPETSGQLRSCRDEIFLSHTPLASKIRKLALQRGMDVQSDVISFVSHACEERLRHLAEKISLVAEHRLDIHRVDQRFEPSHDVRSQIKFLEELDKLERKKHSDTEREVLLKAAKSRSKTEDPEQAKLKLKAKEMKEQELETLRQIEANKTALAAIGPRKRKFDDLLSGATTSTSNDSPSTSTLNTSNQNFSRPRLKRVNMRDLTFVLEEDRESSKSNTLYKSFLR